jgi:hypothetical protein
MTLFEFNMLAQPPGAHSGCSCRRSAQQLQDGGYRKAPGLQIAHLPRLFAIAGGQLPVTALPQRLESGIVIQIRFAQGIVDVARRDPLGLQPAGNAAATVAPCLLADDRVRETLIGKETLSPQIVQYVADLSEVPAGAYQPRFQLGACVLTPREQPDRLRPEGARDQARSDITRRRELEPRYVRWPPERRLRRGSWPRSLPRRHRALSATRGCCPCLGRSCRRCMRTRRRTSR